MHLWLDERMLVVEGSKELRGDWAAKEGAGWATGCPKTDSCGVRKDGPRGPGVHTTCCLASGLRTLLPLLGEGGGQARSVPFPTLPSPPRLAPSPLPILCLRLVASSGAFTVHSPTHLLASLPGNLILLCPINLHG